MNEVRKEILGIDIGNVITQVGNEIFSPNFLEAKQMPGAFEGIRKLVSSRFGPDNVFLVSKCKDRMQKRTAEWLKHHNFYEVTGVREDHVHFCFERHEKAPICLRFGINIFIDDRLEILDHLHITLPSPKSLLLFQGKEREIARYSESLKLVTQVESWEEVLRELLPQST